VGNGLSTLVVPRHHACVKFSTLVEPKLQITRGFATRVENFTHLWCLDYKSFVASQFGQFGHHACVKTITHFSAIWK
jgi:hypothetical protein